MTVSVRPSPVLRRNARARRLCLRIDPVSRRPVLTVPPGTVRADIDRFLAANEDWIRAQLAALPEPRPFVPGGVFPLRGAPCTIRHAAHWPRRPRPVAGAVEIGGPESMIAARLHRWLVAEACADLGEAAGCHARRLGVEIGRISVRDTRSRWGSCSARGTLSFCWRLILAPAEVLDYVAAHETAHLREMNHGPRFWALVESLIGDPRPPRAWLGHHGPALHQVGTFSSRARLTVSASCLSEKGFGRK